MKSVKVISGVYGWLSPENRRIAKTINDPPFSETDVKAARFVKAGVLAYAAGEAADESALTPGAVTNLTQSGSDSGNGGGANDDGKPYNADMKFNDLVAIATDALGLEVNRVGLKKETLLALMDEKWSELNASNDGADDDSDDSENDGTPPPTFTALPPTD